MSKNTLLIILSLALSAACGVLLWMDQKIVAACVGFFSYMLGTLAVKSGASKLIVIASLVSSVVFGYALCPTNGFFCMAACVCFLAAIGSVRLLFFENLGHTKLNWLEPTFLAGAVIYYVVGNIYDGSGWLSWTLPTPGLALASFMVMGRTIENKEIQRGGITKFGVDIGTPAPDFALPDQDGNITKLSDYKNKRHVLLIFVRGDWCPTCHIMLRSYEKNKERFAQKNIMLLALGPDDVGVNKVMMEKLSLDYRILSDAKLEAAKAYGMQVHGNNPMTKYAEGIPLPASFLIDMDGNVLYTSNPKNAGEILNPETIIPVVEKLYAPALV